MDNGALEIAAALAAETLAVLAIVVALSAMAEAITEFFITPLYERYIEDTFWLRYVAAGVSALLVLLSQQSLLEPFLPNNVAMLWVGRVLTAILAGRGSNWLHDFWTGRFKANQLAKEQLRAMRAVQVGDDDAGKAG